VIIEYVVDPSNFYLIGRLFNAIMGTLTVFVISGLTIRAIPADYVEFSASER
jgi:hypothetical protein